jgi:hypothetical protein
LSQVIAAAKEAGKPVVLVLCNGGTNNMYTSSTDVFDILDCRGSGVHCSI